MKKIILISLALVVNVIALPCYASVNLALYPSVTVSANSQYSYYSPSYAVDGNYATNWNAGGHGSLSDPDWLKVDLSGLYYVDRIKLAGAYTYGQYQGRNIDYNLYTGTNGTDWALRYSDSLIDDDVGRFDDIHFSPGFGMRYAKFEVTGGNHWSNLAEIEIYGGPDIIPEPATLSLLGLGLLGLVGLRKKKIA